VREKLREKLRESQDWGLLEKKKSRTIKELAETKRRAEGKVREELEGQDRARAHFLHLVMPAAAGK
jgi:hypothetical protein